MTKSEIRQQILDLYERCKFSDWNQDKAEPITLRMRDKALALVDLIEPLIVNNKDFHIEADVEGSIAFMFYTDTHVEKKILHSWWTIDETGLSHVWTPIPVSLSDEGNMFEGLYYHKPTKPMKDCKGESFDANE